MAALLALAGPILIGVAVRAQTPVRTQAGASRPSFDAFEVATVKPTGPDPRGRWIRMQSANRFEARNHALRTLIAAADDLSPQAISGGPPWVDSDHWDILAKTPGDVRPNLPEQMLMLRQLLNDRFKLVLRQVPKELPVYALTVAKGGAKLKESTTSPDASPEGPPPLVFALSTEVVRLSALYATMGEFASVLQRSPLDRPVIDRTGLSGRYDFNLEFAPDETVWGGGLPRPENSQRPGLFGAVQQQLGLRLEATKGVIDALVIDAVERPPDN
jgi:uncharacterized protein (TIGR03435 family)